MARFLRFTRNTVITLVILALALTGFTKIIRYPNPVSALKLALAPASKTPTLMPWHTIAASTSPITIPTSSETIASTVNFGGKEISFESFLTRTHTNAFLVMRNGVLTYERYLNGTTESTKLPSYSVAKTLTSIMIGQLITAGKIKEGDRFVDFFPEMKTGTAFDRVTVQHLLDMEAGIGVSDNYPTGPAGWGVGIAQMYASTDVMWFLRHNRKMSWEPGTKAEYRSVNTLMLGMIIKKVTGMRVADYFSDNVWQPLGAQAEATWNVDHINGQEKTFACFNATARDYARVGLLLLNQGYVGAKRIVSGDWMYRLSTPVVQLDHDWAYGAQVWHPYPNITMLLGLHGQFVFINPDTRTVIVKLSDNPTGDDPEVETAAVLKEISERI